MNVKLYNKRLECSVPTWFPNTVENWIRNACSGKPGHFFRGLLENDLAAVVVRSDMTSRETLFGMWGMLHGGIPDGIWGTKERVTAWIEAIPAMRKNVFEAWKNSGDYDYWTPDNFEEVP